MKKLFLFVLFLASCRPANAQPAAPELAPAVIQPAAPDSLAALAQWVGTQQAQLGTSIDLHGVKYATTWWDAVSYGQKGLNVGAPSSLDFVDLGPGMAVTHGKSARYGQAVPIHIGNIWNSTSLPSSIVPHFHLATLPNVTISPLFLWPDHAPIGKWTWKKDFQAAVAYRFGGS